MTKYEEQIRGMAQQNRGSVGMQEARPQPEQEPWLLETTQTLAKTLAREFYPEVTQWECLNDLAGVISQIDNMTTGLMRKPEQEPVAWMDADGNVSDNNDHDCFPIPLYTTPPQRKPLTNEQEDGCPACGSDVHDRDALDKAEREIDRLTALVAQPEQEPVAWMSDVGSVASAHEKKMGYVLESAFTNPLYTTPPQRKPLTDEDIALIDWESLVTKKDCVRAIEAKLKEVNNV